MCPASPSKGTKYGPLYSSTCVCTCPRRERGPSQHYIASTWLGGGVGGGGGARIYCHVCLDLKVSEAFFFPEAIPAPQGHSAVEPGLCSQDQGEVTFCSVQGVITHHGPGHPDSCSQRPWTGGPGVGLRNGYGWPLLKS